MAEVLKTFDFGSYRKYMYPWDEWSDGRIWKARQGVDFKPNPEAFKQTLKGAAYRMGKVVRVVIQGKDIVFQFADKTDVQGANQSRKTGRRKNT